MSAPTRWVLIPESAAKQAVGALRQRQRDIENLSAFRADDRPQTAILRAGHQEIKAAAVAIDLALNGEIVERAVAPVIPLDPETLEELTGFMKRMTAVQEAFNMVIRLNQMIDTPPHDRP